MTLLSHLLRRSFSSSSPTPSPSPSPSSSSLVRTIYKENNFETLVTNFKKNSQDPNFRKKITVYENTVQRLANAKHFNYIEQIITHQKTFPDIKKEGFTVRLISLYANSGMFDHARKLFDEMPELNCVRTVKSVNALLWACVSCKRYEMVREIFDGGMQEMEIKPDAVSYNVLIKALREMGRVDEAVDVVGEMVKEGVRPGLVTFNTLFNGLYRSDGLFSEGERVWEMMREYEVLPDIVSYNVRLYGFVLVGKVKEGVRLVEEFKMKGLKPDLITFNTLFKGLCQCKDDDEGDWNVLDEVKRWYHEMKVAKIKPTRLTFTMLLTFACEKGDFRFGSELCRGLFYYKLQMNDGGLVQKVVNGLVMQSNVSEADFLVVLGRKSKHSCYQKLKLPQQGP